MNIDDIDDLRRPAHSLLLGAAIPVVEHLTGLDQLPPVGARFTAAPITQPCMASAGRSEIKQLKAQIKRLRDDNETLKAATVLLAWELDPRNN